MLIGKRLNRKEKKKYMMEAYTRCIEGQKALSPGTEEHSRAVADSVAMYKAMDESKKTWLPAVIGVGGSVVTGGMLMLFESCGHSISNTMGKMFVQKPKY